MRLAAIYLKTYEFLFKESQTINFGGEYIYSFEEEGDNIFVRRKLNEQFIPDFFALTDLDSHVTNLNAIVGQNGAGKSTLLNLIRSQFTNNKNAFSDSISLFLVEDGEELFTLKNNFRKVYLFASDQAGSKKKLDTLTKSVQSIYYSPHYDYTTNSNFDVVDAYDISFDRIVEKDLAELNDIGPGDGGHAFSASQVLIFENSRRQIKFLASDLIKKQRIFDKLFQLQGHYEPTL